MNSPLAVLVAHLLAAAMVLIAPWLGHLQYQRARKRFQAGNSRARVRLYRQVLLEQVVVTATVCGLWLFGGIPGARLGICAPRPWWLTAGLGTVLVGFLVRAALRARPKAQKLRAKLDEKVGVLLPDSLQEQRWFAAISVGAGISEELACRGFLIYYLGLYLPRLNSIEIALLTSVVFGLGHLYQGWRGILKTGTGGMILAGLYLLSGSLLLPMAVHAALDLQVSIIFWPRARPLESAQEAA